MTIYFVQAMLTKTNFFIYLQVGDGTDTIASEHSSPSKQQTAHHHHHYNGKKKRAPVHESLNSAELFNLYNMLNGVKTDLLWGRNSEEQPEEVLKAQQIQQQQLLQSNADAAKELKGHVRRPSTASVASSNSTNTLSDSESEISNENDSGIESECTVSETDKSSELAKQYRTHLLGLYRCLEQMTDAANYLTNRYQSDIGPV